jgi:hypothetical protein
MQCIMFFLEYDQTCVTWRTSSRIDTGKESAIIQMRYAVYFFKTTDLVFVKHFLMLKTSRHIKQESKDAGDQL